MSTTKQAAKVPAKEHASPKDFFLHLLMMVTLYASAISLTTVLFQLINIYIPDSAVDIYNWTGSYEYYYRSLRTGLSTLIVMFPVYVFTMRHLRKTYKELPEKLHLVIRKWLIYFTLFVASIIIMIDIIALLNNFLNGELLLRFVLKALSILFISFSIFWMYITELKYEQKK